MKKVAAVSALAVLSAFAQSAHAQTSGTYYCTAFAGKKVYVSGLFSNTQNIFPTRTLQTFGYAWLKYLDAHYDGPFHATGCYPGDAHDRDARVAGFRSPGDETVETNWSY